MTALTRLLYIDDDTGLARLLQKALASEVILTHAESGKAGLELLATQDFDVIALDHNLINETGLDVLPKIRAMASPPPVIYVTGSEDARIASAALKAGAIDYVWKDTQGHYRELVGQAVTAAVNQRRLEREKDDALRLLRQEKERAETLLREVNHRVANSLALVASLAHLQASAVADPAAKQALREMQARITAIAGVHRKLYTSTDVRTVDLPSYLKSLVDEVSAALNVGRNLRIALLAGDEVSIATDKAVSLGVIVTELITNAVKYAYPEQQDGEIRVLLQRTKEAAILLAVEDDGVGWSGVGQIQGSGLGSKIINAMCVSLQCTIRYEAREIGTRVTLEFAA
jgi:two-component sensor histidine kinase